MPRSADAFLLGDPNLHDGSLTGIMLQAGSLELVCASVEGKRYSLRVGELVRLRADNFLEGNIIFDIRVFMGPDCPRELFRRAYGAITSQEEPALDRKLDEARNEGWTLLSLESSYGCELVALAKRALQIEAIA